MRRSRALALACLALLAALAGCGTPLGGVGGRATDGTPTPAPAMNATAPPGVTADGVNAATLVPAHTDGLANRSYTYWGRAAQAGAETNATVTEARVGADGWLQHERSVVAGRSLRNETVYRNATHEFVRRPTEYRRYSVSERPLRVIQPPTGAERLRAFLGPTDYTLAGTRTADDTPVAVLRATGPENFTRPLDGRRLVALNSTLWVDRDGIVRRFVYNATVEESGQRYELHRGFRVTDVGETAVDAPAWVRQPQFPNRTVTETLRNEAVGAAVTLTGDPRAVGSVEVRRHAGRFADSDALDETAVSGLVTVTPPAEGTVSEVVVTLSYDESAVSRNESGLLLVAFDERAQAFLPLNSTVDAADDTVTASGFADDLRVTIGGEPYEPSLDGRERRLFVVVQAETYYARFS